MKKQDWSIIEDLAEGGERLPAGGYVLRITDVEDVPSKEYLWITYDIAEGEYKGHYDDEFGRNNKWAHRFTRSYKDSAAKFFKQFLTSLDTSNPKFSFMEWQKRSDEREFVGLEIGAILQTEKYTNQNGEDKERLILDRVLPAQDIRNGDYKEPTVKDSREAAEPSTGASGSSVYANDGVPF